jgi:hypothetical protein
MRNGRHLDTSLVRVERRKRRGLPASAEIRNLRCDNPRKLAKLLSPARGTEYSGRRLPYGSFVEDSVAYRFVPCDDEGQPRENSRYTTITTERLDVGSKIDAQLLGYSTWEVVELRAETRPLLGARDKLGNDVPLAGSLICRGVA